MTIVTEDVIRTIVLNVASGTFRIVSPARPARRPGPDQDVAREQGAEQHDLRGQEEPDADLAVGQTGVAAHLDGVGNVHLESGLVLRQEVPGRAGNAVLVGPAVRFRGHEEIAVRGRRRSRPLDRRGLPRVRRPVFSPFQMLQKKLKMNGIWKIARIHAPQDETTFKWRTGCAKS